jgi:arabinose-5-phosphate isomerase
MTSPARRLGFDPISFARRVLRSEASSLHVVAGRLDDSFLNVIDRLAECTGRVAVIGVGKSADIGQKIVGTFNSTGTRAYLLDATRAVHGDLGTVHPDDVALFLSHSGESEELLRLIPPLRSLASALLAITGHAGSSLARQVDAAIVYGTITEACPLSLAPSTSTTVMLALGDALAFTLCELREFTAEDFARFHPAGSLGRLLASVESVMRRGPELRIAPAADSIRTVFARVRQGGRRTGAVMLTDSEGRLAGLFTDSDLARLFESRNDAIFDQPIATVMTREPIIIPRTARVRDALILVRDRKISELPVVDEQNRPVGILDITDLIGLHSLEDEPEKRPSLRLHGADGV